LKPVGTIIRPRRKIRDFVAGATGLLLACSVTAQSLFPPVCITSSLYVAVRDGTLLALEINRPATALAGGVHGGPTVLIATPYHRGIAKNGQIAPLYRSLLAAGYAVASLDLRGRGASFGTAYAGGFDGEHGRRDLYDVIEWLAKQPWSDGKVGMNGCSYDGLAAFWAAAAAPPHLKAIVVGAPPLDWYSSYRINGVWERFSSDAWDQVVHGMDVTAPARPVDADLDGSMLRAAVAEHRRAWDAGLQASALTRALPFRDSPSPRPEYAMSPSNWWNFMPAIRASGLPVLQFAGWRDKFADQSFAFYRNLAGSAGMRRLIIGPWYHCAWNSSRLYDATAENVRWFDHWLRGIDNGAEREPEIRYYVSGAPGSDPWRTAPHWPLTRSRSERYYFAAALPGANSRGQTLRTQPPGSGESADRYTADYTATTATLGTAWHYPNSRLRSDEPGLVPVPAAAIDAKGMVYTSAPLGEGIQVTGFPVVSLWVTSTAGDQDFFVYLEEIDGSGASTLLASGAIRASYRGTRPAPFDYEGLPWHSGLKTDSIPLPRDIPAKIELALTPMSNWVAAGHRIRVTLTCADAGDWDTPRLTSAPVIGIRRDSSHPSSIALPIVTAR
jgi:putative CocE/NonD family hydrolase